MGKGSKPRPVKKSLYNSNFDEIIWNPSERKHTANMEIQITKTKIGKAKRFVYK